jgi:hypothetical protein
MDAADLLFYQFGWFYDKEYISVNNYFKNKKKTISFK